MRKIFIIAGEASGDLHGANLVKALLKEDANLDIQAYGGGKMANAGAKIVRNYSAFAFMGFYEVLINARKVLRNLSGTTEIIARFKPDIIIFIDFPSFNLRVAKRLRKVLPEASFNYYISPKVWAWKSSRVHLLNKLMDQIFVIFPFEVPFYESFGYDVRYVGNPLLDEIDQFKESKKNQNLIAVLPGSRRQEIEKMLPIFSALSSAMPNYTFEVSVMPQFEIEFYKKNSQLSGDNLIFSERSTYHLLAEARAALVTSGTATLETALFNTPQIVAYKTSTISYEIGKRVIQTKYISLVNLILDRLAVPELIQGNLSVSKLKEALASIIDDDKKMHEDYQELRTLLGEKGASSRTAKLILG